MSVQPFHAPRWLQHAHLQTSWAPMARPVPKYARRREAFTLPDGDFINLDWLDDNNTQPLVIVLHGLAGSSDSIYVLGIQLALRASGIGSVAMNFRGAAGIANLYARTYHAGDTGDIDALANALAARFPRRKLAVLGYSLGGNVVLKWLSENVRQKPVLAGCAVSTPFDLSACAARLDQGFSRVYRDRLLRELLANLAAKEVHLRNTGNATEADRLTALGDLDTVRSFRQYDDRIIAPLHGFNGADDYYARSSGRQFVCGIAVPTLIAHALDDPFMTADVVPNAASTPSCVELAIAPHGGHVGFVHGTPWRPRYWLEEAIPAFFRAQFAQA